MKKLILSLILLAYLSLSGSQVFGQTTVVVVRNPASLALYYQVAFHWGDSDLEKWAAENDRKRKIRKIEKKKMLQAQRKRLKELKARLRSPK